MLLPDEVQLIAPALPAEDDGVLLDLLLVDCRSGSVSSPFPIDSLPLAEEYMFWDLPADSDWDSITVVPNKTISKYLSSPALPPTDNGSFSFEASTAHTPVKEGPPSKTVK